MAQSLLGSSAAAQKAAVSTATPAGPTGFVFNIQRYSLHDGPGIRTAVFLSGCPLSCHWCSNPESKHLAGSLMHNLKTCLRCGRCAEVCPVRAVTMMPDGPAFDRARCDLCGLCADNCPPHAVKISARRMGVDEVLRTVELDRPFYRRTGGGITLSGGEPLLQPEFSAAILRAAHCSAINAAIETAGHVPWSSLAAVAPWVDCWLYDVKHLDPEVHQTHTGVTNAIILENLSRIAPLARSLIVRVPVIPGFNATDTAIRDIAGFVLSLKVVRELHLLPYHPYGKDKYGQLGRPYECEDAVPPPPGRVKELADIVRRAGLQCQVGG